MRRGETGNWLTISTVGDERVQAFLPNPLPPKPPLEIAGSLRQVLEHALVALGRLDSVSILLPDTALFLYGYIRKEAVLSSQIEGTQSSLSDLLLFEMEEAPGVPIDDVVEVSCYVAALEHGLRRLAEGFPISNRLLREIHRVLLAKGRGTDKDPGEFRRSQNWIGGTRPGNATYVPPPPERVADSMHELERFIHDEPEPIGILIKAALSHAQFETIHPFLDGNGRLGRLLITLLLCKEGILKEPMLYLSLYFKTHRKVYYDLLQRVRTEGDWEEWLQFFAEGVVETAEGAVSATRNLVNLFERDHQSIQAKGSTGSALQVHHALQRRPVTSISRTAEEIGLSVPTVGAALKVLQELGIVREITGKQRNRLYCYQSYLDILSEGTQI